MELTILLYLAAISETFHSNLHFLSALSFWITILAFIFGAILTITLVANDPCSESEFLSTLSALKVIRTIGISSLVLHIALKLFSSAVPLPTDVYGLAGGYVALKASKLDATAALPW